MIQQQVSINGREVMILESGSLYRVESPARSAARRDGKPVKLARNARYGNRVTRNVFAIVRASCCRDAITFADTPNHPNIVEETDHDAVPDEAVA